MHKMEAQGGNQEPTNNNIMIATARISGSGTANGNGPQGFAAVASRNCSVINPYAVTNTKPIKNDSSAITRFPPKSSLHANANADAPTAHSFVASPLSPSPLNNENIREKMDQGNATMFNSTRTGSSSGTPPKPLSNGRELPTVPLCDSNLPPWQRLPSRTVSFGSAEILTVSELRQNYQVYTNRSVRVTGVLLHKYVTDAGTKEGSDSDLGSGQVAFVLGDPLQPIKNMARSSRAVGGKNPYLASSKQRQQQHPRDASVLATVNTTAKSNTLSSTMPQKRNTIKRRIPITSCIRRLPSTIRGQGLSRGGRGKTIAPDTTPRLLGRKRLLSTSFSPAVTARTATIHSIDSMITTLIDQSSVLVWINPTHVPANTCAVGDLVLVIGDVQSSSSSPVDSSTKTDNTGSKCSFPVRNPLLDRWRERQSTLKCIVDAPSAAAAVKPPKEVAGTGTVAYLQARILSNVDGTDMNLHYEALQLRRLHFLKRSNDGNDNGNAIEKGGLRQGCGPPPYK